MKINLLFSVVLMFCVSGSSLISETKKSRNKPSHPKSSYDFFMSNYNSGRYGPLSGFIVQKAGRTLCEKIPMLNKAQAIESITKSICSLVIGIALKQGDLKDLNQPILDFFPEYTNIVRETWQSITIQDLLTMRSGIVWNEETRPEYLNPTYRMYHASDMYKYIFAQPLDIQKPFNYSSANAALLSRIISKASGKSMASYADEFLFKPLGIKNYKWTAYRNGMTNTSGGLCLTMSDLAKIGQLYLQKGWWKEEEIVNENWIKDSFKNSSRLEGYLDVKAYGYLWWIDEACKIPKTSECIKICKACGYNNNHLLLIPELDVLIATTGNSNQEAGKYLNLLEDVLAKEGMFTQTIIASAK